METIHSWALGLCSAAVIGSVAAVLSPSGTLEKSVKTVIAVFIICAVVLPFFKENFALHSYLSTDFDNSDSVCESIGSEVCSQTEKYFKNAVSEILERNGISCRDMIIQIETEDDTVNVKSVTVVSPDKDTDTVKSILKNEAGIDADVVM